MMFRTLISLLSKPLSVFISCLLLSLLLLFSAPVGAQTLDSEEQAFLKLINDYRTANGLGTLQASVKLTISSEWMSNDMAAKNYFSHTDSLGRDPFTRMKDFGYTYNTWLGENLAAGYNDAQNTFNQWKNSPGHNENMLNPNFKAIGIAHAANLNAYYRYYWTTDFGGEVDAVISPPSSLTTVNAANYSTAVAPDGIVATFGSNLATGVFTPTSMPLPKSLGGTSVIVNGVQADLLYVSPGQINYVLPAIASFNPVTVEVTLNGVSVGKGSATVDTVAPGLFTITADGKGIPAGYSTSDGVNLQSLFNPNGTSRPIDAGTVQKPNYLVLFGTGFRKRSSLGNVQVTVGGILAQIDYAGSQGTFAGLDQLQLIIPPTARGSGETDVVVTIDGKPANKVRVNIGN